MSLKRTKGFYIVAYTLIMAFLFTIIPVGAVWAADELTIINRVEINADYDNATPPTPIGGIISIFGENLQGKEVQLWDATIVEPDGQLGYVTVGRGFGRITSSNSMIQVRLTGAEFAAIRFSKGLIVAGEIIDVLDEPGKINNVDPKIIELDNVSEQITLAGEGLKPEELTVEGLIKGTEFTVTGSDQSLVLNITSGASPGVKHIVLKRVQPLVAGKPQVSFERYYASQFRVLRKWDIDNFKMYPNAGVRNQTVVTFEGDNLENSSVFFVLDEKDKYEVANLATHRYWSQDDKRLQVILPDVKPGTYKVILTNRINNPVEGEDLRNKVTRQYLVDGVFYIMSATDAPSIYSIEPDEGPNEIENEVTITMRRLEELDKISGLTLVNSNLYKEDTIVGEDKEFLGTVVREEGKDNKVLVIGYGEGSYKIGTLDVTGQVYRKIDVIAGDFAKFQEKQYLTDNYDILKMNFPEINLDDYEAVQDVIINITTHILDKHDANKEYIILTQEITRERGFTYKPSTIIPEIIEVIPDSVQVEEDTASGYYITKNDAVLAIKGNRFIVNRYTEGGEEVILYPKIKLGDSITLEREGNKVYLTDAGDNRIELLASKYEVFKGNALVTGIQNNDTGDKIIVHIPAGSKINQSDVGEDKRDISITNYKPKSKVLAIAGTGFKLLSFYSTNKWNPVINKIEPNVVSATEGKKEVQIIGHNFWQDVEVYIGGERVDKVERVDENLIVIDAPPARVGETVLMVQNIHPEGGGQDAKPFFYVATKDNPKITNIAPNVGTIGSQIIISGINFFPPDPSATNIEDMLTLNRLIGSKVLFNGRDINQYNEVGQTIEFKEYTAPPNEPLLKIDTEGNLVLSDYYQSIYLKPSSSSESYFKLVPLDFKRVKLTNLENTEYTLSIKDDAIVAYDRNGAELGSVTVNNTGIDINSTALKMLTPYIVTDGHITGHRTKFIDNESKILVTIPDLGNPGYYDVTIRNPDMMEDTWKNGFYFNKGMDKKPLIEEVIPSQGSVTGGYTVIIRGADFEDGDGENAKTRVWINSVPAQVVGINASRTEIEVIVPPYDGDLKQELENLGITIPRKSVPVAVANPSTSASDLVADAFAYVIPNSKPLISSLSKNESNAAGGEYIQINGVDFRYYEPFFTADIPDNNAVAGRDYIDVNGDRQWTNLSNERDMANLTPNDLKVLPEIYFGTKRAEIIDYGENYVGVKIPANKAGVVDVYLVNNDSGVSNKVKFTYNSSNPIINKIVPDTGNKAGNDKVDVHGQDFSPSKFYILNPRGHKLEQNMVLVKFADITNRPDSESGKIIGGEVPELELEGNLTVRYNANRSNLNIKLKQGDIEYSRVYDNYDDSPVFINLQDLVDEAGNKWQGYELIKLEVVRGISNRLIVERGYAPNVHFEDSGHLTVNIPTYYSVGKVPLTVINPDGGTASKDFTYKNPDSSPKIINILRDGKDPLETTINGKDLKVIMVNYKSNSEMAILGEDFREQAFIHIGEFLTINPNDIYYELPTKLSFTMPDIPEANLGKLYPVVVVNEDGGVAHSDNLPVGQKPIYIQFTKGETDPDVGDISPIHGPTIGGTVVKIDGEDFRARVEGYEGQQLVVYFGGIKSEQVEVVDHKTIYAISPANKSGPFNIRVENPDGAISTPNSEFTYISSPKVTAVINAADPTETTRLRTISVEGGEEIKLKGIGFEEGMKVYFMPETKEAASNTGAANTIYRVGTKEEEFAGRLFTSNVMINHILESGLEGLEVKYIDAETITVKVPAGKLEGKGLIVVNPDKGASDVYDDLTYGLPELGAPLGVTAEIMHDKYNNTDTGIKVTWTGVKGATEYELYVVEDGQMEFIGSTKLLAYIHQDLKARTTYKFIVKAVGDFGSSKPSAESNTVRTGRDVGIPDIDGGIVENTKLEKKGLTGYVNIGTKEGRNNLVIDMTRGDLAGANELVLSIPASVVVNNRNMLIDVKGADFALKLTPAVFNNERLVQNRHKEEAGVRLTVKPTPSNATSSANGLSPIISLKADFYDKAFITPLDYLATNMSIVLDYDVAKANMRRFRSVSTSRYDTYSNNWQPLNKETYISGATTAIINRLGDYSVMGARS